MTFHQQSSSIISLTSDPALTFAQDFDSWLIFSQTDPQPVITSLAGSAVVSTHDNNTLENFGQIASPAILGAGVSFQGNNGTITNHADITGVIGVAVAGDVESITNFGYIGDQSTSTGVKFGTASNHVTLTNTGGQIFGHVQGVLAFSDHDGGHINNTGTISSDGSAVQVQTAAGVQTFIENSGLILGTAAAIESAVGSVYLHNTGIVNGMIYLNGAGQDTIINTGVITGPVRLGGGNDLFKGMQGTSGEVFGEAGNDHLIGSNHADRLDGGFGRDTLTGGLDADKFVFDSVADSAVGATHDVITDFRRGQHDHIDLSAIDANGAFPGDPHFVFRGTQGFTHAGQVRYVLHNVAGTAHDTTMIFGSIDADHAPEFQIEVKGLVHFVAGDFVL